jgi:hypothetical protein
MPKTNIKLVTERSPEREELASAIVAAEEARRGAENARSAVSLAKQIVADASQKHAGAGDALIAAKEAHSTRIATAASSSEALSPDSTLRNARVAEVDAADELHAARDALTSLEAALEDPEADDRRAQKRVAKAVEGVIFSKVADKLAALREEQQALGERRLVLELMLHHLDHFADGRREMRSNPSYSPRA